MSLSLSFSQNNPRQIRYPPMMTFAEEIYYPRGQEGDGSQSGSQSGSATPPRDPGKKRMKLIVLLLTMLGYGK